MVNKGYGCVSWQEEQVLWVLLLEEQLIQWLDRGSNVPHIIKLRVYQTDYQVSASPRHLYRMEIMIERSDAFVIFLWSRNSSELLALLVLLRQDP